MSGFLGIGTGSTSTGSTAGNQGGAGSGLIGGALGAVSGALGMINRKKRERRQLGYQKELMGIQQANQMALNEQGRDLSMDVWNKTNYAPQVAQMQKAGLNPALMYGSAGSGGTTSAGSGGGAGGGSAPNVAEPAMDIANMVAGAQAMADMKLKKAVARKTNAEAKDIEISLPTNEAWREGARRSEFQNTADRNRQEFTARSFKEGDERFTEFQKGLIADFRTKGVNEGLQRAVKDGVISENEVKNYRAELAKAKIDPDSNPLVREMMKAMAAEGVPVTKILQKVVRYFLD